MPPRRLQTAIDGLRRQTNLRAKSLIVTVFGDAVAPHGGVVWLGSLISLLEPFGVNERLVRTAVQRLTRQDWLASRPIGRRSYYSLTEAGRRRFEDAHRRIYAVPRGPWDGQWTFVVIGIGDGETAERDRLRRELLWQGFGQVSATVLAHPASDREALRHVLQDAGMADRAIVVIGRAERLGPVPPLATFVSSCWDLEGLAQAYRGFLGHFRPVWKALEAGGARDPETCFIIRVLLIHEYRRVLLRDPQLPHELLPAEWAGTAARALCRNLYRLTYEPAERHLMQRLETAEGPLPEAAPYFYQRFGGLEQEGPAAAAS
ncbi:MAG: phenylacetic acid degradation operon negative regulatory protein PaaX [Alphaproteobacteria bacterium]|nr:phenylacetic acid degradation operon negative regulatory protein PaaX [Alphaproteobacteria bacterium]